MPLRLYSAYVQPILQLLYPAPQPATRYTNGAHDGKPRSNGVSNLQSPWTNAHRFLNVSITPIECSIVCSKTLAERYFVPLVSTLPKQDQISPSSEVYVAVSVAGEGLEAGQRVLELTSPLAMAGM